MVSKRSKQSLKERSDKAAPLSYMLHYMKIEDLQNIFIMYSQLMPENTDVSALKI